MANHPNPANPLFGRFANRPGILVETAHHFARIADLSAATADSEDA